jgi:hypothetical protein
MARFIVTHSPKIVFLLAVLSLAAGVLLREPAAVFDQAIRICLSCIGIG